MNRITEDKVDVADTDFAWEIMYRYVNPEYSRAEPEKRIVADIPERCKMWFHQSNCRLECMRRNKSRPYQLYEPKFYFIE